MPAVYLLLHLCFTAFCVWLTLRLKPGSRLGAGLGAAAVLVVVGGFVLERRSDWAWSAMGWGWPDAVFFTNLSLEGVAVLLAVLWRGARDRGARIRAALLTPLALGVSLWSLRWFFAPVPANLGGTINTQGFCRQTTDQSCGAAAAVTLLHAHGIRATEAEMAHLCLTREGFGTPTLGIYRGVAIRGQEKGLKARLIRSDPWGDLARLRTPCIVSVGLHPGAPPEVAEEMEGYGWTPGLRHAVVFLEVDPTKRILRVADPSFGLETWPAKGLEWIWDGRALILEP